MLFEFSYASLPFGVTKWLDILDAGPKNSPIEPLCKEPLPVSPDSVRNAAATVSGFNISARKTYASNSCNTIHFEALWTFGSIRAIHSLRSWLKEASPKPAGMMGQDSERL